MFSPNEDATSGDYFVQIDEYLAAAIEQRPGASTDGDEEERGPAAPARPRPVPVRARPKPVSELSPREIQSRLRSGMSVAEVADEAGVAEEWVLRFADPIRAEQARVIEQALGLTFTKPRVGPSAQPLRTSVRWNLAEQGALRDDEVFDAGWGAFNLYGTRWVVRFSFSAKRRRKLAEWEVDLREGELTARNRVATDLGYIEPGRRRKRPPEHIPAQPRPPARRARRAGGTRTSKAAPVKKAPAARKDAASRGAGARKAAKKAAKKAVVGRKAAASRAGATKAATRKAATTKKAPSKKTAVGKKTAGKKGATKRAAASKKAAVATKVAAPKKRAASKAPASKKAAASRGAAPATKAAARTRAAVKGGPPKAVATKAPNRSAAKAPKKTATKRPAAKKAAPFTSAAPAAASPPPTQDAPAPAPSPDSPGPVGAWPEWPSQLAPSPSPVARSDRPGLDEPPPSPVTISPPEPPAPEPAESHDSIPEDRPALVIMSTPEIGEVEPPPEGRRWFSRQPDRGGNPPSHEDWWG